MISIKKKYTVFIIIILAVVLFVFSHSTPQRAIRTSLIKDYPIKALQTEVYKSDTDIQFGQRYSCKNPGIGSDFYTCKKGIVGLWFIDWTKTGGG